MKGVDDLDFFIGDEAIDKPTYATKVFSPLLCKSAFLLCVYIAAHKKCKWNNRCSSALALHSSTLENAYATYTLLKTQQGRVITLSLSLFLREVAN